MLISLDTELTGLDLAHGARPFITTACKEDGTQLLWQWDVCPLTRQVRVPLGDADEIRYLVESATEIVGQALKTEVKALKYAGIIDEWPWDKCQDTLVAGHLLASSQPHDLTSMVLHYCGEDIQPFEDRLREAVQECRRLVGSKKFDGGGQLDLFSGDMQRWRTAKQGDPMMPSAGSDAWRFDYWLPRALALYLDDGEHADWLTVCSKYALVDAEWTLLLWRKMRRELESKGLWAIYRERMKLPRVIADMETRGVSYNLDIGRELRDKYAAESDVAAAKCVEIATSVGYNLHLPDGATNKSLHRFCFGADKCKCKICGEEWFDNMGGGKGCPSKRCRATRVAVERQMLLDLPPVTFGAKTGTPSLDKAAFDQWEATLPEGSQLEFVRAFRGKRKRDTFVTYSDSYARYAVSSGHVGFATLFPNLNQTGTAHLRMSSDNPNSQNAGKQVVVCRRCDGTGEVRGETCKECHGEGEVDFNLRRAFCPPPGFEFLAFDYENIELMIPAYEAGEKKMIALFEHPDEPPYWGSQHLLNASVVYPNLFWPLKDFPPDDKRSFKKRYASREYQWIKNFDFASSYGCGEAKGDATAHKTGAWRAVKESFRAISQLADKYIAFAKKHGYVETLPDKTVDPRRGYPIMTSRGAFGDVSPTIPFNYHVSGTACWAMAKAMPRVHDYLAEVSRTTGQEHRICLQIHDELLCLFPAGGRRNLAKVRMVKSLMEKSGDDIGIPLRVAMSWHPKSWAVSESLEAKDAA